MTAAMTRRATYCVACGDDPTEQVADRARLLTPLHDYQADQIEAAWRRYPNSPERRVLWAALYAPDYACPHLVTIDGVLYEGGTVHDIYPGPDGFVVADENLEPCPACGESIVLAVYRGVVEVGELSTDEGGARGE